MQELDMVGVFRYCNTYPTCLNLLATGAIDVKPMITHHFPLSQINEAITAGLEDPTAIKVIVNPQL
jgi:L-iditol 2-dehydrogenase